MLFIYCCAPASSDVIYPQNARTFSPDFALDVAASSVLLNRSVAFTALLLFSVTGAPVTTK